VTESEAMVEELREYIVASPCVEYPSNVAAESTPEWSAILGSRGCKSFQDVCFQRVKLARLVGAS